MIFFVFLAGLFAGSETGLYRLSRLRMRLGAEQKRLSYVMLNKCVHDGSGLLLSMLVGTNLSHFLATSIITYTLSSKAGTEQYTEMIATGLTAPILFVFSELIPKNLFFYRADALMPYMAPFLYMFHKLVSWIGAVKVLKYFSAFFAKLSGSTTSSKTVISSGQKHIVQAILHDTHEEGILSTVQTDIINRLIKVSNVHLKSIMIPIEKAISVENNFNKTDLLNILKQFSFTRFPVKDSQTEDYNGYINIYEVMSQAKELSNLSDFIRPIKNIDSETTVTDAINFMQIEKQKILLVTKKHRSGKERPIGIITMKDLVEELLGELAEW